MTKKNFLTKDGYEKLAHELHTLKTELLPEIVEQIKEAKAEGDLSENSDYHAAKEKQALTMRRILEIEQMLQDVEIIEEEQIEHGNTVRYGSHVTIKTENGKEYAFRIVGSAEVAMGDPMQISFESPIGKALEGRKEGETIFVRLTEWRQEVKILSVA